MRADRTAIWQRDHGRCVRCGTALAGLVIGHSCHHRILRGQGGPDIPSNLIMLCGTGTTGCHGWAHHNRIEAEHRGYILPSVLDGVMPDPSTIAVWSWFWQHDILLDDRYGLALAA